MIRENVVDRLHRDLAVRDVEALADDYTALLARTHPHRSASSWHFRRLARRGY